MSAYPPPTEFLPIFNSSVFYSNTALTLPFLKTQFLTYPVGQSGQQTLSSLLTTGSATFNGFTSFSQTGSTVFNGNNSFGTGTLNPSIFNTFVNNVIVPNPTITSPDTINVTYAASRGYVNSLLSTGNIISTQIVSPAGNFLGYPIVATTSFNGGIYQITTPANTKYIDIYCIGAGGIGILNPSTSPNYYSYGGASGSIYFYNRISCGPNINFKCGVNPNLFNSISIGIGTITQTSLGVITASGFSTTPIDGSILSFSPSGLSTGTANNTITLLTNFPVFNNGSGGLTVPPNYIQTITTPTSVYVSPPYQIASIISQYGNSITWNYGSYPTSYLYGWIGIKNGGQFYLSQIIQVNGSSFTVSTSQIIVGNGYFYNTTYQSLSQSIISFSTNNNINNLYNYYPLICSSIGGSGAIISPPNPGLGGPNQNSNNYTQNPFTSNYSSSGLTTGGILANNNLSGGSSLILSGKTITPISTPIPLDTTYNNGGNGAYYNGVTTVNPTLPGAGAIIIVSYSS